MTIAVDLGCKATKQTNKKTLHSVPEVFTSFIKLILKKSADENKSAINNPACNEFQIVLS